VLDEDAWVRFDEHVDECLAHAPIFGELLRGSLPNSALREVSIRYYAEVRTFIDLKLPSRIRLCPHEASHAKQFFAHLYVEEQGDFATGKNHAQLFASFCATLGVTQQELDAEYERYWPRYSYLLTESPSPQGMIRELSISCAWESVIVRIGDTLMRSLSDNYGFSDEQLDYFRLHVQVDQSHAAEAQRVLRHYVTDEQLMALAKKAVYDDLIEGSPWKNA